MIFSVAGNYLVYHKVFFNTGQPVAEWPVTTKTYDTPEGDTEISSACRKTTIATERPLTGLAGPTI